MTPARARGRDWLVLAGVFVVLATAVGIWIAVDRRPPEWDHANHLERAVACAKDLDAGDVERILERSSFYPPLVPCAAGLLYRVLPSDAAGAQTVVLAFLAIGMVATYLLGRRLVDATAGLAAALLFATAPFVVYLTLRFQLDLPLAAMVALALWTLVATEAFTRPGWALALGIAVGLGMLTKPTFPVYVGPPLLLVLARVRGRGPWITALGAGLVAAVLTIPWYGPRLAGLPLQVGARSYRQAAEAGHPDPFSWGGAMLYPRWAITQFGLMAVLLLLAGVIIAVRRRQLFALVALAVPFAVFELLQNKNLRYTLPILPAAAVVAGMTLSALAPRARRAVAVAAAIVAIAQVSATLTGVPAAMALPRLDVPWLLPSPPMRADWKQRDILRIIAVDARTHGDPRDGAPTVSLVPNAEFFSVSNFRYYAVRDGLGFRFTRAWDDVPLGIDYMVVKSGDQGPTWTAAKPRRINDALASDATLARAFPVIAEFDLPDGSRAAVRARRIPPVAGPPARVARAIEDAVRLEAPSVARDVDGLDVTLDWDETVTRGHVRRIVLAARVATLGELKRRDVAVLRVHDARLTVEDAIVNPWSATGAAPRFELLDARAVTIDQARIEGDDLAAFIARLKEFRGATVGLEEGGVRFVLGGRGPTLAARVGIAPAVDRPFALVVDRLSYAGIPVPAALVNWIVRNFDPTPGIASRLPVPVHIGRVSIGRDAVRIGAPPTEVRQR
jgi:dolichyl-phosphate-mannose-protein mannosyltransferase